MKQFTPVIYKGIVIFRNEGPGYRMRYYARLPIGDQVCADTLQGIKQLITSNLEVSK